MILDAIKVKQSLNIKAKSHPFNKRKCATQRGVNVHGETNIPKTHKK